uniref:Uncharacterized protein n=1 Tax=Ciona intestinalis TaxID=7719 RepID=H2XW28_CIOIN
EPAIKQKILRSNIKEAGLIVYTGKNKEVNEDNQAKEGNTRVYCRRNYILVVLGAKSLHKIRLSIAIYFIMYSLYSNHDS